VSGRGYKTPEPRKEKTMRKRDLIGGALSSGGAAILFVLAARTRAPQRRFTGTSKTGSLDEALAKAIASAARSAGHPDALVSWRLDSVSGRSGGIAGFREVKVVIEASVD